MENKNELKTGDYIARLNAVGELANIICVESVKKSTAYTLHLRFDRYYDDKIICRTLPKAEFSFVPATPKMISDYEKEQRRLGKLRFAKDMLDFATGAELDELIEKYAQQYRDSLPF